MTTPRQLWQDTATSLLTAAQDYRNDAASLIHFPGPPSQNGWRTDGLEGFARTFILAAFTARHHPQAAQLLQPYFEGIQAALDPATPVNDQWPRLQHISSNGQPQVEAASISLGLLLTKDQLWDHLPQAARDRIVAWLAEGFEVVPAPNNWYLFSYTTATFFHSIGLSTPRSQYALERGSAILDTWYQGDGWYTDGDGPTFDYYAGWALHFYPVLLAYLTGDEQTLEHYGQRLRKFLHHYQHFFGADGSPVYYSRSLTYRWATAAPIALGGLTGYSAHEPHLAGQSATRILQYFLDGDPQAANRLTLGWHGPSTGGIQRYSGPGSPYWAAKGFVGLLAGPDHPMWAAPTAATEAAYTTAIVGNSPTTGPGTPGVATAAAPTAPITLGTSNLRVHKSANGQLVKLYNPFVSQLRIHDGDAGAGDPLYSRLAYSNVTGPTVLHNLSDNDAQLAFNDVWSHRRKINLLGQGEHWAAFSHVPRFPVFGPAPAGDHAGGGAILPRTKAQTYLFTAGDLEIRLHRFCGYDTGLPIRVSGWQLTGQDRHSFQVEQTPSQISIADDAGYATFLRTLAPATPATSATPTTAPTAEHAPAGSAFGPWGLIPATYGATAPVVAGGETSWLSDTWIAVVTGLVAASDLSPALAAAQEVTWQVQDSEVVVSAFGTEFTCPSYAPFATPPAQ